MAPRTGKALIQATRPFAEDDRARSWFHVVTTFLPLIGLVSLAALDLVWPVRALAAVLAGMVAVRGFILYHDYLHHAILRNSKLADLVFKSFGHLVLVPSRVWKQTHNHHHTHNARLHGSHIGSFEVMTVQAWNRSSFGRRLGYRLSRHPLTIAAGYLTVFAYGMCFSSLLRSPKRNWDSALALVLHAALLISVTAIFGPLTTLFTVVIPIAVACALGSYLFYVQHNFEGVKYLARDEWTYAEAALESSSYLKCGPILRWFTGNIGYHHVHHLNPLVPFYRLPEAMAAIPELQDPPTVTLSPSDILRSVRLNLWDPERDRMIRYSEAKSARPVPATPATPAASELDESTATATAPVASTSDVRTTRKTTHEVPLTADF